MALVIEDRVKETTSSNGTGNVVLLGASVGFVPFSSVCQIGDTAYYCIAEQSGSNWEIGLGTYIAENTLQRNSISSSSNSNLPVNFPSGIKDVFITAPANALKKLFEIQPDRVLGRVGSAGEPTALSPAQFSPLVLSNDSNNQITIGSDGKLFYQDSPQNFVFTQAIPSSTWVINHSLNRFPSVSVVDSANSIVEGNVEYASLTQVVVSFSSGFSGKAYLN